MVSEQSISFKSIQYLDKFDLVVHDASDGSVTQCCDMIWQALAISRFGTFGDDCVIKNGPLFNIFISLLCCHQLATFSISRYSLSTSMMLALIQLSRL
jgi:hypothetical protein